MSSGRGVACLACLFAGLGYKSYQSSSAVCLPAQGIATRSKDATRGSWPRSKDATRGSWPRSKDATRFLTLYALCLLNLFSLQRRRAGGGGQASSHGGFAARGCPSPEDRKTSEDLSVSESSHESQSRVGWRVHLSPQSAKRPVDEMSAAARPP